MSNSTSKNKEEKNVKSCESSNVFQDGHENHSFMLTRLICCLFVRVVMMHNKHLLYGIETIKDDYGIKYV